MHISQILVVIVLFLVAVAIVFIVVTSAVVMMNGTEVITKYVLHFIEVNLYWCCLQV